MYNGGKQYYISRKYIMNNPEIIEVLEHILTHHSENELLEFKEAKNDFDFKKLWKYFSALSNEANLKNKKYAWLVFWVTDDKKVVGTNFKNNTGTLLSLKWKIGKETVNNLTFLEIFEVFYEEKRVILFQIPAASRGIPTSFQGHYYARNHEELVSLNIQKLEQIRSQSPIEDFSIKICKWATVDDLDSEAIKVARKLYFSKNKEKEEEGKTWDDITFLNKAKITISWKITNTAILLLWKEESEHFLSPSIAKISWILKDRDGIELDYEHFSCPFILQTKKIFSKIRNLKYRYMNEESIFPEEVQTYEPYIIREALHNCIAHQDYTLGGKINIIENPDSLIFSNKGAFIPETVKNVIDSDCPPEFYRNRFLASAMINLNMIDTIGSGIRKMFILQKNKFFPLPDYDITDTSVTVKIIGKVLDINYAKKLVQSKDELSLDDIILLDKVQKHQELTTNQIKYLKRKWYIEWRKPNFHISLQVAQWTELMSDYIKQKGFKDEYYRDMILEFIKKNWSATKEEIRKLVYDILPNILSDKQKEIKISNLIGELRKKWKIYNVGESNKFPLWKIN